MVDAYDPHTLITFGGKLAEVATDDEIWECGVRGGDYVTAFAPVDSSEHAAMLAEIVTPTVGPSIADWFTDVESHIPAAVKLQWIKAVNIGADGKYTSDPTVVALSEIGGSTVTSLPSFLSVCLSFTTDGVGRRNRRGRVYPPNFAVAVATGATIDAGTRLDLVASAQELIGALSPNGSEFQFTPSVVSSKGGHEPITGVRVGNVIDVQRRRKNAVSESYAVAGL